MKRSLRSSLGIVVCLSIFSLAVQAGEESDNSRVTPPITRIAFGACARESRPQPVWEAILSEQPQLFVFLGDNIYADTDDMRIMKLKYDRLAGIAGFRKLRESCRVLATWDDHDYGRNDAGADYPKRRESQQVFLDFWGVSPDSPRRQTEGVYDAHVFGPDGRRVQVILLDTRYFRSSLRKDGNGAYRPIDDAASTMLGAAQWKWLAQQLRRPAEFRVIASSIQVVAAEHPFEKWANMPRERQRLFRLIRETKAGGIVLISGDRHLAEISRIEDAVDFPLLDFTSSGLNQKTRPLQDEPNRYRLGSNFTGANFGLIRIDWTAPDPTMTVSAHDVQGKTVFDHRLQLGDLQPAG